MNGWYALVKNGALLARQSNAIRLRATSSLLSFTVEAGAVAKPSSNIIR